MAKDINTGAAEIAVDALRINPQGELEARVGGAWVSARDLESNLRRSSSPLGQPTSIPIYNAAVVDKRSELTAQIIVIPASSLTDDLRRRLDEFLIDRSFIRAGNILDKLGLSRPQISDVSPDNLLDLLSRFVLEAARTEKVERAEEVAAVFVARLAYEAEVPLLNSPLKGATLVDIAKTAGPLSVLVLANAQDRLQLLLLTGAVVILLPPLTMAGKVLARWVDVRLSSVLGVKAQSDQATR